MLQTLRLQTNVEVPIGARRLRDEPVDDRFDSLQEDTFGSHDPDVWPPPTPVDHGYLQRLYSIV